MTAQQEKQEGVNLNDPNRRKEFKASLTAMTYDFGEIDKIKDTIKEDIAVMSQTYGIDKKMIRKLAVTMYKRNYSSLQEENEHFAEVYETIIESQMSSSTKDPLHTEETEE